MALTVGEVQAVLSAKDNLTPTMKDAAERVLFLKEQVAELGATTIYQGKAMSEWLEIAEQKFIKLRDSGASAVEAVKEMGPAAGSSAERLAQLKTQTEAATAATSASTSTSQARITQLNAEAAAANEAAIANQNLAGATRASAAAAAAGFAPVAGSPLGAANAINVANLNTSSSSSSSSSNTIRTTGAAFMNELVGQYNTPLTPIQQQWLDQLKEMNALTATNAERLGISRVKFNEYSQAIRESEAAARRAGTTNLTYSQSFQQLQGVTQRLLEQMAIFSSVIWLEDFIKQLYLGAEQLVNMRDQLQMTTDTLQIVKYGAEQTGIEWEQMTTVLQTFNKNVTQMKPDTVDAIHGIGLSMNDLFAMQPQDRFEEVVKAIAEIPDQSQRAAIELKLFGTDAVDPLIMKFADLKKAASESGVIMSESEISALAETAKGFRWMGNEADYLAGKIVTAGQNLVQFFAMVAQSQNAGESALASTGMFGSIAGWLSSLVRNTTFRNGRLEISTGAGLAGTPGPNEGLWQGPNQPESSAPNQPLNGQAFIESLRAQSQEMVPLTREQRNWLDELRKMNVLTAENAAKLDITTVQFKEYQKQVQEATKALNAHNAAEKAAEKKREAEQARYDKSAGDIYGLGDPEDYKAIVAGINGAAVATANWVLSSQGMSAMHDLQVVLQRDYGLTESQVTAIGEAWKKSQAEEKIATKSTQDSIIATSKLWDEYASFTARAEGDTWDKRRADIDTWFNHEVELLNKSKSTNDNYWNQLSALEAVAEAKRRALGVQREEEHQKSLAKLTALEEAYSATVEQMSGNQADIQIANIKREEAQKIASLKRSDEYYLESVDVIKRTSEQRIMLIMLSMDPLWEAWRSGNQDMRKEWSNSWESFINDPHFEDLGKLMDGVENVLTAPFRSLEKQFKSMLAGMMADLQNMLLAPMLGTMRNVMASMFGLPTSPGAGFGGMGGYFGTGSAMAGSFSALYSPGSVDTMGAAGNLGSTQYGGYSSLPGMSGMSFGSGMSKAQRYGGGGLMAATGLLGLIHNEGALAETMSGMQAGMGIGTMIAPGIGTAIGAGVGALGGYIRSLFGGDSMLDDVARDGGKRFGQKWSDNLTKSIEENAKRFKDEIAGETYSLPQIMAENPVNPGNVEMYTSRVRDVFIMLAEGKFTLKEATDTLDDTFPQLAKAGTDAYGRISDGLRELIDLNQQFGTDSQVIAQWQQQQGQQVLGGAINVMGAILPDSASIADQLEQAQSRMEYIDARLKDLRAKKNPTNSDMFRIKALEQERTDLTDKQKSLEATVQPNQDEVRDLGAMAVGSYATAVATGTSKSDALKAQSEMLTRLENEYKRLGMTVDDAALRQLFMMNNLQKAAPTLMAGIEGVKSQMVSMGNLGIENAEQFRVQERLALSMYQRLQAQVASLGGTAADALLPMQDYLRVAADQAKKLGIPLDDATQAMIDQSKELGIWKDNAEAAKSPTEKLADAIERLVRWLKGIPDEVNTDVNVDVNVNPPDVDRGAGSPGSGNGITWWPEGGSGEYGNGGAGYASGGRILPFRSRGVTDREPIMATPGEGIVNLQGMANLGDDGLAAINSGKGFGGGDKYNVVISVVVNSNATNAEDFVREAFESGGFADQLVMKLAQNKRGLGTRMRKAINAA